MEEKRLPQGNEDKRLPGTTTVLTRKRKQEETQTEDQAQAEADVTSDEGENADADEQERIRTRSLLWTTIQQVLAIVDEDDLSDY
jgi:hypothetical protein